MVNKRRLYWTLQIGGWLLYTLLQVGTSLAATGTVSPKRSLFLFGDALLCLVITHLFRIFLNRRKWLYLSMARLIPRVLVSVGVLGLIIYFLRLPLSLSLGFFEGAIAFDPEQILIGTAFYALIFFLWSVFYFTYHYFERYSKSLKYEASVIQIELNNLRSQLNPHFIFNALNSIRALVDENPAKSKQAINQLANILRKSLTSDKKGLTKFEDELKIVKDYLGLESIRFEERLKTEFSIHPDSHHFLVPPLMIQTLVENGIKHGISKLKEGGIIQLNTTVRDGSLRIQIRNSGHMVNGAKRSKSGLGIKNTIQRLKLIYGDRSAFRIANENDNFVLTEIIIPPNNAYESINR
ncbi:MAG TPA: histidine kinase [Cyclobacteriaceae bacterium]